MTKQYTLTKDEAKKYDEEEGENNRELWKSLKERFGTIGGEETDEEQVWTEVYHPDGFLVEQFGKVK